MDKFKVINGIRYSIQLIAFSVFCYQMVFATNKYLKFETSETYAMKTIDQIPLPHILVCQRDQYDWAAAEALGYRWRHQLYKGKPQ